MRFLQKNKISKTIIVISDIHLGAGAIYQSTRNTLEDFHFDKELVDFLKYFSSGKYLNREVELIINGDLLDFLAVPYVNYFDDDYWSEAAALCKLEIILAAHSEVIAALVKFITIKNKSITYIIGNHDAEMILPRVKQAFLKLFAGENKDKFKILENEDEHYSPEKDIIIKHGHEFETAHHFSSKTSITEDQNGRKYFVPPWGSYYVVRVINKYKEERDFVNAVRPIKKFLINGIIYDTLFTLRFSFSTCYYFLMVRFIYFFKMKKSWAKFIDHILNELKLFIDDDTMIEDFTESHPDTKVLIVGHTHDPILKTYSNGTTFINTGTWTRMYNLDFGKQSNNARLTYAQLDFKNEPKKSPQLSNVDLFEWKGSNSLPFEEFI